MAAAFFVNGAVQANWVTRLPAEQEELSLSAGALGTALLGLPVGLTATVPVTGWLVARLGSRLATEVSAPTLLPAPLSFSRRCLLNHRPSPVRETGRVSVASGDPGSKPPLLIPSS